MGNYQKYVTTYKLSDERVENIIAFLNSENIEVLEELPQSCSPISSIKIAPQNITLEYRESVVDSFFGKERTGVTITEFFEDVEYNNKLRVYKGGDKSLIFGMYKISFSDEGITVNTESNLSEKEALRYAANFYDLFGDDKLGKKVKIFYKKESYGADITYYELYNNLPVFDSYLYMKITDEGVFESTMQVSEVKEENSIRNDIYAVDQVLFKLHQIIKSTEVVTINNIVLGYGREQVGNAFLLKETAVPMYKVTIDNLNIPLFVNSYTNEVK